MKTSKSSSSANNGKRETKRETRRGAKRIRTWDGGVEITLSPSATVDVRFLGVALRHTYMFDKPLGDLTIARNWSTAFTLTCMEIDQFLGADKRGFHWRQLDVEDGQPHWYWALDSRYDQAVRWSGNAADVGVAIVSPAADPQNVLRTAIRNIVERGMRRATFFNQDAANEGALQ